MSSTGAPHLAAVAGTPAGEALEPRVWGPRFAEALGYSCEKHNGQIRKGNGSPYITHPLAVASLVGEYGGDEDQAIAALLHDLLEDCEVTAEEIAARFGTRVADIVLDCSDTTVRPKPPWRARKEAYLRKLESVGADSKLVITADKLHNAQCIVHDLARPSVGVRIWSRFRASREEEIWYFQALVDELGRDWQHDLLEELRRVVERIV
jgi:GTP pyrophosphokinase